MWAWPAWTLVAVAGTSHHLVAEPFTVTLANHSTDHEAETTLGIDYRRQYLRLYFLRSIWFSNP